MNGKLIILGLRRSSFAVAASRRLIVSDHGAEFTSNAMLAWASSINLLKEFGSARVPICGQSTHEHD